MSTRCQQGLPANACGCGRIGAAIRVTGGLRSAWVFSAGTSKTATVCANLRDQRRAVSLLGQQAMWTGGLKLSRPGQAVRGLAGGRSALRFAPIANALDDRPDDLAHLLRRVADEIDRQGLRPNALLDVTISQEITGDGPWWSATVYWAPDVPA